MHRERHADRFDVHHGRRGRQVHGQARAEPPRRRAQGAGAAQEGPGSPAGSFKNGVCDLATKAAIVEFQNAWGSGADGTVDPTGQTLRRLGRIASPLVLKPTKKLTVRQLPGSPARAA
jgi:hypothetical protein